ncbi:MAG: dihydroorotase [Bacteroidia bacterium]|nr:dihydroorotase [Bacteroidia bacterium]
MSAILIKNAFIVNEGDIFKGDVLITDGRITEITENTENLSNADDTKIINADGKYLIPGIIDDQVHFREPGFTHKAEIYTEAKAGIAGGVTSFMEMPNTNPQALTQELLEEKYQIGAERALANYSFFMGASNDNIDEVLKTDPENVCGLKIFMGSSTGDMLVDDLSVLQNIFSRTNMLIAVHCEDEETVKRNFSDAKEKYGEDIPISQHPIIRNEEACYKSSSLAIELAKRYNARLHILHISTEKEIELFDNSIPLEEKRITSEACVHHLWFDADDYEKLGTQIKCNPAIKEKSNKEAILKALLEDKIDIIATDHAPHTWDEKQNKYETCPAGVPLIQHSLNTMLEFYHQNKITLEKIVEKMCHAPANCFQVKDRGFIRKGYWADLVLVDLDDSWKVEKDNLLYKCNWSPFEGYEFKSKVTHTFVNGNMVYENGNFEESIKGKRLQFERF